MECVHDLQRHFKTLSPFIAAEFHPHFVGWNNRSMPSESVGTEKSIVLLIILCTSTPDAYVTCTCHSVPEDGILVQPGLAHRLMALVVSPPPHALDQTRKVQTLTQGH